MDRSKLLNLTIKNLGCIGEEGLSIDLDNILCLVGENNGGKSTVLHAYELAVGTETYSYEHDHCKRSIDANTTIEVSVHIPENTGNIAEKWKEKKGEYLVVTSIWEWDANGDKTRKTWDPELKDYSDNGNASGLDEVFNSRLPVPFRIGALQNPQMALKSLLKLIVDPIAETLKSKLEDPESDLYKALATITDQAKKPVEEHQKKIEKINQNITSTHNKIFPNLSIDLNIGIADIKIDPTDALIKGSKLNFKEFNEKVDWEQQGTGSQRALFWSLLQVRSRLQSISNIKLETDKKIKSLEKEVKKLEGEKVKAKKEDTRTEKQTLIDIKNIEIEAAKVLEPEKAFDEKKDDISLPGYMLLIDEPEIALHPNAIRAASQYLYELANDPSWQVMLTTHSPLFINPLQDHTSIVRLTRDTENPIPRTYRSDAIKFSENELENLKLLNSFDQNLAEMFFGQYTLIVEGDTEFASFERLLQMHPEKYSLNSRPLIIRARGKFTIISIIKMLTHFIVNFSVLHDSDYPKNKAGNTNNVWTGNKEIYDEILKARSAGLHIIHRVSISSFEVKHLGVQLDMEGLYLSASPKDKPWIMYDKIKNDDTVRKSVEAIFDELIDLNSKEEQFDESFLNGLTKTFEEWVLKEEIRDKRFSFNK